MRATAILNLKGGVAKTTTVVNMAAILADRFRSKRILVIDCDSQCNTTDFFLGGEEVRTPTVADLLRMGRTSIIEEVITAYPPEETNVERVDIIPAADSLMDLDLSAARDGNANTKALYAALSILEGAGRKYSYVLFDCPPAFNAAAVAALEAANDVIIPVKYDGFSMAGMKNVRRQISNAKRINHDLQISGILPTMWTPTKYTAAIDEHIHELGLPVYHHIRRSDTVDKMTFEGSALISCSKNSGAGADYKEFVDEYIGRARK